MRRLQPGNLSAVVAWCLYDWAYSAFNTVVSTFVIATYFVRAVAPDPATGTAQWAIAQAAAGLVIAVAAAPLGVLADRAGWRHLL
jgi:UMF1 family MFS transporter